MSSLVEVVSWARLWCWNEVFVLTMRMLSDIR